MTSCNWLLLAIVSQVYLLNGYQSFYKRAQKKFCLVPCASFTAVLFGTPVGSCSLCRRWRRLRFLHRRRLTAHSFSPSQPQTVVQSAVDMHAHNGTVSQCKVVNPAPLSHFSCSISRRPQLFLKLEDFFWREHLAKLALPYGIKGSGTLTPQPPPLLPPAP